MCRSKIVFELVLLASVCAAQVDAQGSGSRDKSLVLSPGSPIRIDSASLPPTALQYGKSKWSHGVYIRVDLANFNQPVFYLFDAEGKPGYSVTLSIPNADRLELHDFDTAPDRSLWVCGDSFSVSGQVAYFIAHIRENGNIEKIIRTTPYWAFRLAVSGDGSVWTVGPEEVFDETGQAVSTNQAANVLHHFSPEGTLMGTFVQQSTLRVVDVIAGYLAANGDAVGWYSPTSSPGQYTAISTKTGQIHRNPGIEAPKHSFVSGFALTASGHPFVTVDLPATPENKSGERAFYTFEESTAKWQSLEVPRPARTKVPMLKGAEGEALVFSGLSKDAELETFKVDQR